VAYSSGLRRSEILNLSWADVDFEGQRIHAGHSNIATTRKYYLAVRPEDMASASRVVNEILQGAKK